MSGSSPCADPAPVRVETRGRVRWITLDRPATRNALTREVALELGGHLAAAGADAAVRVVVLTGRGGAFCSGADLGAMARRSPDPPGPAEPPAPDPAAPPRRPRLLDFQEAIRVLHALDKPTLAAVDGAAVGFGCDLALACDLRWASERARFGEGFVKIGLVPDGGGSFFLPRLVGLARAYELVYEGRLLEADEAQRLGLVNRVLPDEGFAEAVQGYAERLAAGPPRAYARAKQLLRASAGDLGAALERECAAQLELLRSAEHREGVRAFREKRPPVFEGEGDGDGEGEG